MEKVILYGDSYADPYDNFNFRYSWPRELAKLVNLDNRARMGWGPNSVCEDLSNLIYTREASDLKDTILIIFLPESVRFNFSFYKTKKDQVFGQLRNSSSKGFIDNFLETYTEKDFEFVARFNEEYSGKIENLQLEEFKHLGFINSISKFFKKVLVWRTDLPLEHNYDSMKYFFDRIDIAPVDTTTISLIYEAPGDFLFTQDRRINHISIENHEVMLEQLTNWIFNNKKIVDSFHHLTPIDNNIIQ